MVLDWDPGERRGTAEGVANQHGLNRSLDVQTTQDIVRNALSQKPDASPNDLVLAFAFYLAQDAFLQF